jgi:hypothetical protein
MTDKPLSHILTLLNLILYPFDLLDSWNTFQKSTHL